MVIRILNLYAGIGGNAKNWHAIAKKYNQEIEITHVEINEELCHELSILFPDDYILRLDAHDYLEWLVETEVINSFDIIWSSPPCQTHSRMNRINSKTHHKHKYVDPSLMQQIILLRYNYQGIYFIENVHPYYGNFFEGVKIGRHTIWSNIDVTNLNWRTNKKLFLMSIEQLQREYGIKLTKNIYLNYPYSKKPEQVYRNAVHPKLGELLLIRYFTRSRQSSLIEMAGVCNE